MLKAFGAVLVLVSCGAAGIFWAEEKKRRLQSLHKLQQFFMALQGEIRYGGTPLKEAIEIAGGGQGRGSLYFVFSEIASRMEKREEGSFSKLWKEEFQKGAKGAALQNRDLERIFRVGESLGLLDRETQLNSLEHYLSEISCDIGQEEKAIGEKVRLCRWLGALAGVFICILMI